MTRNNTNQPAPVAEESFVRLHTAVIAMIVQVIGGAALGYIAFGVVKAFALSNDRTIVEYKDIRR